MRRTLFTLSGIIVFLFIIVTGFRLILGHSKTDGFRVELPADQTRVASGDSYEWSSTVMPIEDALRSKILIDGKIISAQPIKSRLDNNAGLFDFSVTEDKPGYHFIETVVSRRGNRKSRVVDGFINGPFTSTKEIGERCTIAVAFSGNALNSILSPFVERQLVKIAKEHDKLFGSDPIVRFAIRPRDGGVWFAFSIDGDHSVACNGALDIVTRGREGFSFSLKESHIDFSGPVEILGAILGVVAGFVITGGTIGTFIGGTLGVASIDKAAQMKIENKIRNVLKSMSDVKLFPYEATLAGDDKRSAVKLSLCRKPEITARNGLSVEFSIAPQELANDDVWTVHNQVNLNSRIPKRLRLKGKDIVMYLSLDLVNLLLNTWAENGFLASLLEKTGAMNEAKRQISEWTYLELKEVRLGLPPVIIPSVIKGKLEVAVGDVKFLLHNTSDMQAKIMKGSFKATMSIAYNGDAGTLDVNGNLDIFSLNCVKEKGSSLIYTPCFEAFEDSVIADIDSKFNAARGMLPVINLRDFLMTKTKRLLKGGIKIKKANISLDKKYKALLKLQLTVGVMPFEDNGDFTNERREPKERAGQKERKGQKTDQNSEEDRDGLINSVFERS